MNLGSPALEATPPGKTFLTLVWIGEISWIIWVAVQVVEETPIEEVDCWMNVQTKCIQASTRATGWVVA